MQIRNGSSVGDKQHKENIIKQFSLENASLIQLSDIEMQLPKQINLFS